MTFSPLYFTTLLVFIFGIVLIIGIYSYVKIYELFKLKQLGSKASITGFIISISLYGLYKIIFLEEKGAFIKIILGPFLMIFLPFSVHFVTKNIKKLEFISKILLLAISYTMIGIVLKILLNNIS